MYFNTFLFYYIYYIAEGVAETSYFTYPASPFHRALENNRNMVEWMV